MTLNLQLTIIILFDTFTSTKFSHQQDLYFLKHIQVYFHMGYQNHIQFSNSKLAYPRSGSRTINDFGNEI